MNFRESEDTRRFRAEVRELLRRELTLELRARVKETGTNHAWSLHRAIAARGWLRAAIPVSLGGEGKSPEALAALFQELDLAGAPYDGVSNAMMVGSTLARVGSDFHKEAVLSTFLSGEQIPCLGYSEPGSGSDVAAASTQALRDGAGWRIRGQKLWTSLAEEASHAFLLARTRAAGPKHKGLTFFLVPMESPGIQIQAIRTLSGKRSNATYWDDVYVDDRWRVGEVDGGWQVMLVGLAYERGVAGGVSDALRLYRAALVTAEETLRPDGTRALDDASVRERLVRTAIDAEVAELLAARAAWVAASDALPGMEGAQAKLFATEAFVRASSALLDVFGPELLVESDPYSPLAGQLSYAYRYAPVTTTHGGTSEIQRNLIAERGLGLPRAR
jgi:alkylation response protein AidB-like acyl-CoA dehydrogenase